MIDERPATGATCWGVDFSCAPSKRKPITVARAHVRGGDVVLQAPLALPTLQAFADLLATPGPWLAGCDFPFGLPRAFVQAHALGEDADTLIARLHERCPTRRSFQAMVDAWGNTRPTGQRLIHRRADTARMGLTSSSPLQTRYVPVGFMYYEGYALLRRADVQVPGVRQGDPQRVALEAYPGALAQRVLGRRSYKNRDAPERRAARAELVDALRAGEPTLGLRLHCDASQAQALVDDPLGDCLDAVLALMQAAWASQQPGYGLPSDMDPVEGWIVGPP